MARGLWVHLGLLVVSVAASLLVWTRDPGSATAPVATVTAWAGRPDDVQRIALESPAKKVSLEPRTDARGRWYFGTAESRSPRPDAGLSSPPVPVVFASVESAQKIVDALAPFKALREIGRIDSARCEEFGFKEPASTVIVTIGGAEHRLALGGTTPNGSDRYVRDEATSVVYSTHGDFLRDLELGEMALSEHELHDFQDPDILSVRIVGMGKSREVVRRGPPTKRIWADAASPDKADETVSNWLNKVDRLRPTEYAADLPAGSEPVARLDFKVKGEDGTFFEITKVPGVGGKFEYYVRSEHTRLWGKVHRPLGEQVDQDLASVFLSK
ncbi:MAG TPA: DUF4340 domain-containing protein [Polyangiaceae bacterium]|jgi:hypothetical protein